MNKFSVFAANFFLASFRHIGSISISVLLIIIGAIWSKTCLYIGLFLIVSNIIVAFIGAIKMQKIMNYRSDDDPEFNEMMDKLSKDPDAFLSEIMETKETNKQLHGEELLTLSDDDLFETVYLQILDVVDDIEDENEILKPFNDAQKTVYILSLFDAEIQNGGLCQFFVNSTKLLAPYISESLKRVNATEHLVLFNEFITANNIDVENLNSFKTSTTRGYIKQTKRFNYDSFDDKYYELSPLQEKMVAYIKENITQF